VLPARHYGLSSLSCVDPSELKNTVEIPFSLGVWDMVKESAALEHRTPENQVVFWVEQALGMSPQQKGPKRSRKPLQKCLVPNCPKFRLARGLCQKHYSRLARWMKDGFLREGWLVRHGKILGEDPDPVYQENLNSVPLPTPIATRDDDAKWFFDWPASQQERDRLYKERDDAIAREAEARRAQVASPPPSPPSPGVTQ
jgi:hypothetical protein